MFHAQFAFALHVASVTSVLQTDPAGLASQMNIPKFHWQAGSEAQVASVVYPGQLPPAGLFSQYIMPEFHWQRELLLHISESVYVEQAGLVWQRTPVHSHAALFVHVMVSMSVAQDDLASHISIPKFHWHAGSAAHVASVVYPGQVPPAGLFSQYIMPEFHWQRELLLHISESVYVEQAGLVWQRVPVHSQAVLFVQVVLSMIVAQDGLASHMSIPKFH